ncbi:MAG: hypothetical protein AAFZ04_14400 [Pseudomonadota bacterium]
MSTTTVCVVLLVLFGALLAGKMLKDMFPGTMSNGFKADEDARK